MIALWPFDLKVRKIDNNVTWLRNEKGIRIIDKGQVRSKAPPDKIFDSVVSANAITVETLISTDLQQTDPARSPARIVSYSIGFTKRNFTLGQDNDCLVFRLRTTESSPNGLPSVKAEHVFPSCGHLYVVATYDGRSAKLYLNGQIAAKRHYIKPTLSNWDNSCFLVLGNEITGNRPWSGEIRYLAIYNRALSEREIFHNYSNMNNGNNLPRMTTGPIALYTFGEYRGKVVQNKAKNNYDLDLCIPQDYNVSRTVFALYPFRCFWEDFEIKDFVINIIGFIPMSFVFYLAFLAKFENFSTSIILSIVMGFVISTSIEFLQTYSMIRFAMTLDIIYNLIGVIIGLVALYPYHKRVWRKKQYIKGL